MIPAVIEGANCKLGEGQDEYKTLHARAGRDEHTGYPMLTVAFELTPNEIASLATGTHVVELSVLGGSFPPVHLHVRPMVIDDA